MRSSRCLVLSGKIQSKKAGKSCNGSLLLRRYQGKMLSKYNGHRFRHMTPEERFWAKVDKRDGCWGWTGSGTKFGYGNFYVNNKMVRAHRFSYELHKGPVPNGHFVMHTCDNPKCTNPEHLEVGTNQENIKDMRRKGRSNDWGRKGPARTYRQPGRQRLRKEPGLRKFERLELPIAEKASE